MSIERLRALEKKWRDESVSGFDGDGNLSDTWTAQAMRSCADELATLIAELGQEVGAVEPVAFAVELPDGSIGKFGWMDYASFDLCTGVSELLEGCRYVYAYRTSPAHTSEARDAVSAELERAVRKFPTWPTDPLHAVAVLGEEFGELTKAVLQSVYEPHKVQPGEVRAEAVQTAAMALRFLQSLDAYVYSRSEQHSQDAAMRQEGGTP